MKPTPLQVMPKGIRWPWYPLYITEVEIVDQGTNGLGQAVIHMRASSTVTKQRIGIRRWAKHHAKRLTHPE